MREVSYDETKALLEDIVKDNEQFVYTPPDGDVCVNWVLDEANNRVGSCIVGQAVAKLEPQALNIIDDNDGAYGTADGLERAGLIRFDSHAAHLLAAVQQRQDQAVPWGQALEGSIDQIEGGTD